MFADAQDYRFYPDTHRRCQQVGWA
jgi:hypothetical protein